MNKEINLHGLIEKFELTADHHEANIAGVTPELWRNYVLHFISVNEYVKQDLLIAMKALDVVTLIEKKMLRALSKRAHASIVAELNYWLRYNNLILENYGVIRAVSIVDREEIFSSYDVWLLELEYRLFMSLFSSNENRAYFFVSLIKQCVQRDYNSIDYAVAKRSA